MAIFLEGLAIFLKRYVNGVFLSYEHMTICLRSPLSKLQPDLFLLIKYFNLFA